MANPEGGSVNRTIDDSNAVVNSGSVASKNNPDAASDTEQYGGFDGVSHKSGSKNKACFQITHITSKRNAGEHDHNLDDADSNDELDESRAEECSSSELVDSFNISRNSISDHEQVINDGAVGGIGNGNIPAPAAIGSVPVTATASASGEEQTNSNVPVSANQANGNGPHRFKVVKVATEPIRKGRWTCRDFPSETKSMNQTTPDSIRNQDSSKDALVHSGNSSAASSVHYIHGQDNSADNPLSQVDEGGKQLDLSRKISSTSSKDIGGNQNDTPEGDDGKDERIGLEQLKDELQEHTSDTSEGGGDDGTSPAGGAIDNKIEQAMDLVKSHLLYAVREEVEVLKEQIKILVEKNEMLQEENSTLKQRLQQQKSLTAIPAQQPQQQQQQQQGMTKPGQQQQQQQQQPPKGMTIPTQQQQQPKQQQQGMTIPNQQQQQQPQPHQSISMPSQEQPAYTTMPNQMSQAGLGQTSMGQGISDMAAYPQHPRPTQAHSTPNPGGLPEATPQYTPQSNMDSQQSQYQGIHSQRRVSAGQPSQQQQQQQQTQPQAMQGQYPAPGSRQNAAH